jgi:hypothetical protein
MEHPTPTSRLAGSRHCTHLRHKGMYVLSAPNPDEAQPHAGNFAATAYWCTRTMKALGPDGQPVHRDSCRHDGGRGCCAP